MAQDPFPDGRSVHVAIGRSFWPALALDLEYVQTSFSFRPLGRFSPGKRIKKPWKYRWKMNKGGIMLKTIIRIVLILLVSGIVAGSLYLIVQGTSSQSAAGTSGLFQNGQAFQERVRGNGIGSGIGQGTGIPTGVTSGWGRQGPRI